MKPQTAVFSKLSPINGVIPDDVVASFLMMPFTYVLKKQHFKGS